ncbi:hypothetical protein B5E58_10895 [Tyzzerella sp. An114]|uniref:hypothetical protein n=1 Tax=Tyzzerella sp. An114 TaxID=1965545 RepID=UPI000B42E715|nr:hypothetical protein [Tyzzerella sp. An114]OUQ56347.1 hypothetical protein B5E58_10895 [Tyzzerella sp. An114]HIT73660.1 hypothetical protein [Candidatus Fimicola cottocaccae]
MEKELEIAKAKELRGDIIERLYAVYPGGVSVGTLKSLLRYKSINSESDIRKALYYLEEKEYITATENENYLDITVNLTPKGINLAENDLDDVGVDIDE